MQDDLTAPSTPDCDVIVVGAGPVGLLLSCFLGQAGLRVVVIEKRTAPIPHSAAIGITPPSLHILARLGLEGDFLAAGLQVRDCVIHGESGRLGCVSFRDIPDKFRCVLALPQSGTISLLQQKLAEFPHVTLHMGTEVTDVTSFGDAATVVCRSSGTEGTPQRITARWVVACDGSRSRVRELVGIPAPGRTYARHFVMGDFMDRTDLGDEAHLFFKASGSVESFPLPQGLRRWIVQTPEPVRHVPVGFVADVVKHRTRFVLSPEDQVNESTFTPRRFNSERYHHGRIILCGDAAHGMSPIGGQGMNTGFADAEFLSGILPAILQCGEPPAPLLAAYNRFRRKAAATAIFRAEWGMWLGTLRGRILSGVRDFLIRDIMCRWPLASHMGPFYAMLTIPFNTLERVPLTPQLLLKPDAA